MSSSTRAASKGGKGSKVDKVHKSDKSDSGKNSGDKQPNNREANAKVEDPGIKEKVRTLMEMCSRTEEEVCLALHECDDDIHQVINLLLEGKGEWETTTVKKKKNRQSSASKKEKAEEAAAAAAGAGAGGQGGGAVDEWGDCSLQQTTGGQQQGGLGGMGGERDRTRGKSGGPPRLHGRNNDSRGWRGRERPEHDRNSMDERGGGGEFHRERRGRPGGPARGGGGRGGRGGRTGGRYPPRGRSQGYKPMDTWDNSSSNTWDNSTATAAAAANSNNHGGPGADDNWDDFPGTDEWSTEEYTGSLADTKVFTPSVQNKLEMEAAEAAAAAAAAAAAVQSADASVLATAQLTQTLQIGQQTVQMASQSPVPMGQLNAAQTQYLSQLQQGSAGAQAYQPQQPTAYDKQPPGQPVYGATAPAPAAAQQQYGGQPQQAQQQQQYGSAAPPAGSYVNSSYSSTVNSSYGGQPEQQPSQQQQQQQQQPTRTKTQRARLPPPSKIPSSAVEMPGDLNTIGYLDVQFGAMDFMSDGGSFDGVSDAGGKYGADTGVPGSATSVDMGQGQGPAEAATASYGAAVQKNSAGGQQGGSIGSALSQSLGASSAAAASAPEPSASEQHLGGGYGAAAARGTSSGGAQAGAATSATASASTLDLSKQQDGSAHGYAQQTPTYNSYPSKNQSYNASSYSASQTTSSSYVANQSNSNYVNSQQSSYNQPSANTYQNAYSSTASYQNSSNSGAYPSITQANSYPTNNQSYPQNASQSVYGANSGLNNNSNFGNTSTSQYNSYSSASNHKLVKDNTYDNSSSAVSSAQTTSSTNIPSTTLSLSQTTSASSKTTTTSLAAKNSNNVVSNIPPGVTPVMSTPYILGQVPYFPQQTVYSYEDMQILQQRMPHLPTPFYDMSYQTPTTLATVRDAAALGNVGYSISDGRFTRADNNASPVPSTLSQQTSTLTQGHQAQPILAGTAPQYFFAPTAAFNTLPNYQFGTMYTQLPAATNAHGSTNSNQYPKPATYGSGYGAYDALGQTQDYTKGNYVSNAQGQKGAGGNASTAGSAGNDLSAMYGKSHAALGKVNSYEKQAFHSGTPPPYTGALHGSQNAGLAPSGTGYAPPVYIPTIAPHQQHHSTQLMHQPLHQMDVRHQNRRMDSGSSNAQRSQASNQAKAGAKQPYSTYSSWNQA